MTLRLGLGDAKRLEVWLTGGHSTASMRPWTMASRWLVGADVSAGRGVKREVD